MFSHKDEMNVPLDDHKNMSPNPNRVGEPIEDTICKRYPKGLRVIQYKDTDNITQFCLVYANNGARLSNKNYSSHHAAHTSACNFSLL